MFFNAEMKDLILGSQKCKSPVFRKTNYWNIFSFLTYNLAANPIMAGRRRLATLLLNHIKISSSLLSNACQSQPPPYLISTKSSCLSSNGGRFRFRHSFSSLAADKEVVRCWACGIQAPEAPFLACPSCKSVQPLDSSLNFFQIFNVEPGFDVDAKDLERKYKDWQKKLHPDLFQRKSEQEREYSAQQSAQVINAYNTLLRPLSRAVYLLQLKGIHVDEEKTVSDPELLMEIMEVRESVEAADNVNALKSIQNKMQSKLEECHMSFATAYKKHDFTSAVSVVQKMSYYERVNAEIVKKL